MFPINYNLLLSVIGMHYLAGGEETCYRAIYADLQKEVNPDDIAAKLFSAGLLTESEIDEIENIVLTQRQRMSILLRAVRRSINVDPKNFSTFLNILDTTDRYKPIVARANNIQTMKP